MYRSLMKFSFLSAVLLWSFVGWSKGTAFPQPQAISKGRIPVLRHIPPDTVYGKAQVIKQALNKGAHLIGGAQLSSPNPRTAKTISGSSAINILQLDATRASAQQIENVANAINGTPMVLMGTFKSASDRDLKHKLGAGLLGVNLDKVQSGKQVKRFLSQIYLQPLGNKPVGPDFSTNSLLNGTADMTSNWNRTVVSAVTVSSWTGAKNIDSILKGGLVTVNGKKQQALDLVYVDQKRLGKSIEKKMRRELKRQPAKGEVHAAMLAEVAKIEKAAKTAGVSLAGKATSTRNAHQMYRNGYRVVFAGSDAEAVISNYMKRSGYADIKRDPKKETLPLAKLPRAAAYNNYLFKWITDEKKPVDTGFLQTPDVALARAIAKKTSAIWVDAEHGPFTPEAVATVFNGLPKKTQGVLRVGSVSHHLDYIKAGLQTGRVKGVVFPRVNSAKEAQQSVAAVQKIAQQLNLPFKPYVMVMIESRQGVKNAEAIARVKGVDLVHLGPYDLATDMQTPFNSEAHKAAISQVKSAVAKAGKPFGGNAFKRSTVYENAYPKTGPGMPAVAPTLLVTVGSEQELIGQFFKNFLKPSPKVRTVASRKGADPLDIYGGQITIIRPQGQMTGRQDGTTILRSSAGVSMTGQLVSKKQSSGQTFDIPHRQVQVTHVIEGNPTFNTKEGRKIRLGPGDTVIIPQRNVPHSFTDPQSGQLKVIDILDQHRSQDIVK